MLATVLTLIGVVTVGFFVLAVIWLAIIGYIAITWGT